MRSCPGPGPDPGHPRPGRRGRTPRPSHRRTGPRVRRGRFHRILAALVRRYEFGLPTFWQVMLAVSEGEPGTGWGRTLGVYDALVVGAYYAEDGQLAIFGPSGDFAARTARADGHCRARRRWATWSTAPGTMPGIADATHFMAMPWSRGPPTGSPWSSRWSRSRSWSTGATGPCSGSRQRLEERPRRRGFRAAHRPRRGTGPTWTPGAGVARTATRRTAAGSTRSTMRAWSSR